MATFGQRQLVAVVAEREQQVDEPFRCRLWMMVGEAHALVGFDEHVVRLVRSWHQQVQAHHRYFQCASGSNGGVDEFRVQAIGDVVEHPARMQVRRAADRQMLPTWQYRVVIEAGILDAALGFPVQRDSALAAGCGLAATALGFDQLPNAVAAVTECSHG